MREVEVDEGGGLRLRVEYAVTREGADERAAWVDVRQAGEPRTRRVKVAVQVSGY